MRIASLQALVALNDPSLETSVKLALSDKEKDVRIAGLQQLQEMKISKDLMVSLLSQVIATKTMEEKQAAILTLGRLPSQNSGKALGALMDKMEAGALSPDLYLELGEAADSSRMPELISRYKSVSQKISPDDLKASYAGSLLGGDADKGRGIFFYNQNAQCMRCHSYDDRGGDAGPRLNGVASRITRPQILEALISPSARIAPGFGISSITLKDGKKLMGVVQSENQKSLVLKIGGEPNKTILKSDIEKRTDSPSSMPDMTKMLSKREIRDVVSFLATLKED